MDLGYATKPILAIGVGLIFAAIYFVVFYLVIKKFNLKTPGREDDEDVVGDGQIKKMLQQVKVLAKKAEGILEAIGGSANIESIDACITRIRLTVVNGGLIDEKKLKSLGASGVMKLDETNYQIVVGTLADPLVTNIKQLM